MSITKSVISEEPNHHIVQQNIVSTFKIPLLTLVPVNSLVVDNVDIDFSLEIVSYTNDKNTKENDMEDKAGTGNILDRDSRNNKPGLSGKLSYDASDKGSNRSHNASKLNVKIHAGTIPLPLGVTTLIDLYTKSINAIPKQE